MFLAGHYGPPPGELDNEVLDRAFTTERGKVMMDWAPPQPSIEEIRREYGQRLSDEELLLRYLIPAPTSTRCTPRQIESSPYSRSVGRGDWNGSRMCWVAPLAAPSRPHEPASRCSCGAEDRLTPDVFVLKVVVYDLAVEQVEVEDPIPALQNALGASRCHGSTGERASIVTEALPAYSSAYRPRWGAATRPHRGAPTLLPTAAVRLRSSG